MSWKLQKWCHAFVVVEDGRAFCDEIHFLEFLTVRNNHFSRFEDSAVHVDDKLVLEADFSVDKEVTKLSFKRSE